MVTVMETSHVDQSRDTADPRLPGDTGRRDANRMFGYERGNIDFIEQILKPNGVMFNLAD